MERERSGARKRGTERGSERKKMRGASEREGGGGKLWWKSKTKTAQQDQCYQAARFSSLLPVLCSNGLLVKVGCYRLLRSFMAFNLSVHV